MKFNLLTLLFIFIFQNTSFAETLTLQCTNIGFKIMENKHKAFIRYSIDGKFSEVNQFMTLGDNFRIVIKERYNPSKCDTIILSLYNIDRNTGTLTKKIISLEPENGKPNIAFLEETKSKFKVKGDDFLNAYFEAVCKPKTGPATLRTYETLGYSKSQIENIIRTDEDKWNDVVRELRRANCEKVKRKF